MAFEIVGCKSGYQGFFQLDIYKFKHEKFDGGWSGSVTREVFIRTPAVALLPYDPVRDRVVMVEQFRIAAYLGGYSPWLFEGVAGICDSPGESLDSVARREAREEAGLEIGAMEKVCDYLASPGGSSETIRLYVGQADTAGAGGIHGLDSEDEDIRVHVLDWAEARARLDEDRLNNAAAIMAMQHLALHRDRLRRAWTG